MNSHWAFAAYRLNLFCRKINWRESNSRLSLNEGYLVHNKYHLILHYQSGYPHNQWPCPHYYHWLHHHNIIFPHHVHVHAGLVLMTVLVIVMHSHSFLMGQKMSMISRIITTGAIYKKVYFAYVARSLYVDNAM